MATVAIPAPPVPIHWIDTEAVRSTDVPCTISDLDVQVSVCGLYAEVCETMVIANPNDRPLSTSVTIAMPGRAVVCGYALDIDGQMVDGVVVPKEQARVAFETEQRRGADPGLVEAVGGNVYRTRVYPVPAKGTRTVRLRSVAPLVVSTPTSALFDIPMPADAVRHRKVRIEVEALGGTTPEIGGMGTATFARTRGLWCAEAEDNDLESGSSLRVCLPALPASFALLQESGDGTVWFCASRQVARRQVEVPTLRALTILWDASGSRAGQDHTPELDLVRIYCTSGTLETLDLIVFADEVRERRSFATADELVAHLEGLAYDGGTDFRALATHLEDACEATVPGDGAFVLFTDGLDTLSGEPLSLGADANVLAVVTGAERDLESVRQASRGCAFDLAAAPRDHESLRRALFSPDRLRGVTGTGIADVMGIGSGADGRYTVIGRLCVPETSLGFADDETPFVLRAADARKGATLAAAWAAVRVSVLSPRARDNADELLSLGRRFGVVSPVTSLLVLESLDQWLRYEIEPPKSLRDLHREWKRVQRGRMRHTSEEGRRAEHLRRLRKQWKDLMSWWERDYPLPAAPAAGGQRIGSGRPSGVSRRMSAMGSAPAGVVRMGIMPERIAPRHAVDAKGFMGNAAPSFAPMDCVREGMAVCASAPEELDATEAAPLGDRPLGPAVFVKPWQPDEAYLDALNEASREGGEAARAAYRRLRPDYATTPSFFLDCAGWFMVHDDPTFGITVLTNLAEMRIEDAALLRVMAWRLREAGELDLALATLRRVLALRPEDSQSHRDVALVLDELCRRAFESGDEEAARSHALEAADAYRTVALTPWPRRAMAVGLFAVEEYNALRAWVGAQRWEHMPELSALDSGLEGVPDCDLRITLAWDADETDVDLHVSEPSGEEAYYGHRFTGGGGRVSEDITDGYGPELYQIRHAQEGTYTIRAHYFASHQQTVFGPATCTLTVFTDWGRPSQMRRVTSVRLDDAKQMLLVGTASYGDAAKASVAESGREERAREVALDMSPSEVTRVLGVTPEGDATTDPCQITWRLPGGRIRVGTFWEGRLMRMVEVMPWGEEMIVV